MDVDPGIVLKNIRRIERAGGRVNQKTRTIALPRTPGIGVLGAADGLVTYAKYKIVRVKHE